MHIYHLPCIFQAMKGYQRAPESRQQVRHHAKQLGIHSFHRNLSDAVTEITSHHIDLLTLDGEKSHTISDNTSKAALKPRLHRMYRSRREGHSSHSGSVSDESNCSDGSGCTRGMFIKQHASSFLSPGMKHRRSYSSGHSIRSDLSPIAQSPLDNQLACGGSSAEAISLDSQAKGRRDDTESLPFGSQPTVSTEIMLRYCICFIRSTWLFHILYTAMEDCIMLVYEFWLTATYVPKRAQGYYDDIK